MKIIGLTCSEIMELERPSQKVNEDYIDAVVKAGAIPVLLPIVDQDDMIEEQLNLIDGLIVTGGIDVNPLVYHENPRFEQDESSLRRDMYEMKLIKMCSEKKIPLLGICRGIQAINVAFDGTLYQDNKHASSQVFRHQQKERKDYPSHSIHIEKDSFLYPILGHQYNVNSFHHQSIHQLAKDFSIIAKSDDNIIEAIEHNELDIYAVQFHPEMMHIRDPKMQQIFDWFVKQCQ